MNDRKGDLLGEWKDGCVVCKERLKSDETERREVEEKTLSLHDEGEGSTCVSSAIYQVSSSIYKMEMLYIE
jgi:hydrogenase maturation factor HypE